ncbi:unannotated protein [freshwater metagenome]|uniref:Unannotated protein n=1 Tax=freshwater metagenome TaxID=449393 RepID=A0A6J6GAL4_9ZZZZ
MEHPGGRIRYAAHAGRNLRHAGVQRHSVRPVERSDVVDLVQRQRRNRNPHGSVRSRRFIGDDLGNHTHANRSHVRGMEHRRERNRHRADVRIDVRHAHRGVRLVRAVAGDQLFGVVRGEQRNGSPVGFESHLPRHGHAVGDRSHSHRLLVQRVELGVRRVRNGAHFRRQSHDARGERDALRPVGGRSVPRRLQRQRWRGRSRRAGAGHRFVRVGVVPGSHS